MAAFDGMIEDRLVAQADTGNPARDPLHGRRIAITVGTAGLGLALVRKLRGRGAR